MSKFLKGITCAAFLLACTTGCYHMPTEEDYSLIPSTNNPDFTREGGGTGMPGVGY